MSSNNSDFANNVIEKLKKFYNKETDAELADFLGVGATMPSNWRSRNTINYKVVLAKCKGMDWNWLFGDHPLSENANSKSVNTSIAKSEDLVSIRVLDITATAGHGGINDGFIETIGRYTFSREWIKKYIGLPPKNLFMFPVSGDSMEPAIYNKDLLMGAETKELASRDGVYLFWLNSELFVKRIQHLHDGLLIISDNNQYKPYKIPASEMDSFSLVARVVRVIRRP